MSKPVGSPWGLFKRALQDYRRHFWLIAGTILVVSLPLSLLSVLNIIDTNGDTTAAAYASFAQLAMNTAVIYIIIRIVRGIEVLPSIREAYYKGSGALIRLLLVSVMLIFMLLFLLLALFIITTGVVAPGTQLGHIEQALLIGLAAAVALPSLWFLPRSLWAIYLVFESSIGPIEAIQTAWRFTAGRTWKTLGYIAALGVMLLLLLALPVAAFIVLQPVAPWPIWEPLLQLTATLVVVPLSNLYLYRYFWNLRQ